MTPDAGLDDAAWQLLSEAMHEYRDSRRSSVWLRHHLNRLTEPLRLAVTGAPGAGKSTLVNALVGDGVAPIAANGAEPVFTWYQDGPAPRVTLCPVRGAAFDVPVEASARGLRLTHAVGGDLDEVVVEWPTRALRRIHLIDTPPVGPAAGPEAARTAERVLREADAVLYVTRHLGEDDLGFLWAARDGGAAAGAGVPVLAVLSRADETAGGRIDALVAAKQVARQRRRDPRLAELCADVLAVSPLLAHVARTLTGEEYGALAALAAVARADLEPYLLSADRFTAAVAAAGTDAAPGAGFPAALTVAERRRLLDRFGLFGMRLATTLVRTACRTRTDLADRLAQHSGLAGLQESISTWLVGRRPAVKARAALVALDWVLRSEPCPAAAQLAAELDRLAAGVRDALDRPP